MERSQETSRLQQQEEAMTILNYIHESINQLCTWSMSTKSSNEGFKSPPSPLAIHNQSGASE